VIEISVGARIADEEIEYSLGRRGGSTLRRTPSSGFAEGKSSKMSETDRRWSATTVWYASESVARRKISLCCPA
jgi:hypothetical protein